MTTAGLGDRGLGVEVYNQAGMQLVVHEGVIEGFNSVMAYLPERRIAVIILSNVNSRALRPMMNQLLNEAAGAKITTDHPGIGTLQP